MCGVDGGGGREMRFGGSLLHSAIVLASREGGVSCHDTV